jgi:hypothetical protein
MTTVEKIKEKIFSFCSLLNKLIVLNLKMGRIAILSTMKFPT